MTFAGTVGTTALQSVVDTSLGLSRFAHRVLNWGVKCREFDTTYQTRSFTIIALPTQSASK